MKYINSFQTFTLNESIRTMGAAFHHLDHPYDNRALTFKDIKEIIKLTVYGLFNEDNFIEEKTDGQNLMATFRDGRLFAARNDSQMKNRGARALDVDHIGDMFNNVPEEIKFAFIDALRDMENAISKLPQKKLQDIFQDGQNFMSFEIITTKTANIIPYGMDMLVFHGLRKFDEDGNVIEFDKSVAKQLEQLISDLNLQIQERFYIRGPHSIDVQPFKNADERYQYYMSEIESIMIGLTNNSTIGDYLEYHAIKYVSENYPEFAQLNKDIQSKLAARLLEVPGAKTAYKLTEIKHDLDPAFYEKYVKLENKKFLKMIMKPLEKFFANLGYEMIQTMQDFLAANPTHAAEEMQKNLDKAIRDIKEIGDEKDINDMIDNLSRITDEMKVGGIIPTEGITFVYKDHLYKYTGAFSAINQICNMLKFKKTKKENP